MILPDTLIFLLKIQTFVTIPNFSEHGRVSRLKVTCKIFPFLILLSIFLSETIYILFGNINPIPSLNNKSDFIEFSTRAVYSVNRLEIIAIIIVSYKNNKHHLTCIKSVLNFRKKFVPSKKNDKKLIGIVIFVIHYSCYISYYYILDSSEFNFLYVVMHFLFIVYMFVNDTLTLYCITILRHLRKFALELINTQEHPRNNYNLHTLMEEFLKIIPLINTTFGEMIFVMLFRNAFSCTLALYFILCLKVEETFTKNKIKLTIACTIWIYQALVYIFCISTTASKLTNIVS